MIKEIVREEIGMNGIVHKYISYVEIPDEILKPKKKVRKESDENEKKDTLEN